GRRQATARYAALMAHYGMAPTTNNLGEAHENGDVEQAHFRFKQAVDQALRVRGSREFADRAAYRHFLQDLVRQRNLTRHARFAEERQALRPLPRAPLDLYRELRVPVSRGSTIQVLRNTYSLPSRLIGTTVTVRVRAEILEIYHGTVHLLTIPRLLGERQHRIDYRHISGSLVRKPGAFAQYRYRDELFPTLIFRRAYDALIQAVPHRADRDYVRLLHLAAGTSEAAVGAILAECLALRQVPAFDLVRDRVRSPETMPLPFLLPAVLDFDIYDDLLRGEAGHA
ncbi:MAG: IS21 family transposase, partial [Chloroflexota bacterium]|nr:IS21 family transposase [Chloroflexota bacterium]